MNLSIRNCFIFTAYSYEYYSYSENNNVNFNMYYLMEKNYLFRSIHNMHFYLIFLEISIIYQNIFLMVILIVGIRSINKIKLSKITVSICSYLGLAIKWNIWCYLLTKLIMR